jgi:hypothetical protein
MQLFLADRATELDDREILGKLLPKTDVDAVLSMALLVEETLRFVRCCAAATVIDNGEQVDFMSPSDPRSLSGTALIHDELKQARTVKLRLVKQEDRWAFAGVCAMNYDAQNAPINKGAWAVCSAGHLFSNGIRDSGTEDPLFGCIGHHPPFGRAGAEVTLSYRPSDGRLDWWLDGQQQASVKGIAADEGICFCVGSNGGSSWRLC